jgi:hypothetical protein
LFEERPLAVIGLHALARRFERGADRDEHQVVADTLPLGRAFRAQVKSGAAEFAIDAPSGGKWLGSMMAYGTVRLLVVRTFIS